MSDAEGHRTESLKVGHHWERISDLPPDFLNLENGEVAGWLTVWRDLRAIFEAPESVKTFNERLVREWSIETGLIEGLYTIDRGTTVVLIEKGFREGLIAYGTTNRDPEWVLKMLQAHEQAMEALLDIVGGTRELTIGYIKQLHAVITAPQKSAEGRDKFGNRFDVELRKGQFKQLPNNPRRSSDGLEHQYSPPEHVASEMEVLLRLHQAHQRAEVPPAIEAAWLHHRFVQIHPFQDGNGRVARCLASLVFLKSGGLPVVVRADDRDSYLSSLESADRGDLRPLVEVLAGYQVRDLQAAAAAFETGKAPGKVTEVIQHGRQVMAANPRSALPFEAVVSNAERLLENVENRFVLLKEELDAAEISGLRVSVGASVETPPGRRSTGSGKKSPDDAKHSRLMRQAGFHHGYWADDRVVNNYRRIELRSPSILGELFLSFHGHGSMFIGVAAGAGILTLRALRSESIGELNYPSLIDHAILNEKPFLLSYAEAEASMVERFEPWMEDVLAKGLALWFAQHR